MDIDTGLMYDNPDDEQATFAALKAALNGPDPLHVARQIMRGYERMASAQESYRKLLRSLDK